VADLRSDYRPKIYGHRGSPLTHAENTLPSFRHALAVGADGLEMDVHVTRDGVVVVAHDADGGRSAGIARSIADSTFSEVQTWPLRQPHSHSQRANTGAPAQIPSLREVLSEFPAIPMSIDIKPRSLLAVPRVLEVLRSCRAQQAARLASFHHTVLHEVRRLGYEGSTGLSEREVAYCTFLPGAIAPRFLGGTAAQVPVRVGPSWLSSIHPGLGSFAHPAFMKKAKALGLEVHFWTINDASQARDLAQLGADALVTDDPALLVETFKSAV
jgi:glycerophosphoryl diester phosphodiesterase